jgi:quinol-cytochrome oxidoreductase complex cytochrome b subunit
MGLGVAAGSAFLLTLVTGVLLLLYYKAYPDVAYESVKVIHFIVPTGRMIRNLHRWAANIMVVTVILHMARVFYTSAYRAPREFNWLIGMALFVVTLGLSFTGIFCPGISWLTGRLLSEQTLLNPTGGHRCAWITGFFDPGGIRSSSYLVQR